MANTRALAQALRDKGRNGDTDVVHVNEQEKAMLKAMGGSGTINPETGLEEYSGIGGAFGRWIRGPFHQKVIRPIGTMVAGYWGGPFAAMGAQRFEGWMAGESPEEARRKALAALVMNYAGNYAGSVANGGGFGASFGNALGSGQSIAQMGAGAAGSTAGSGALTTASDTALSEGAKQAISQPIGSVANELASGADKLVSNAANLPTAFDTSKVATELAGDKFNLGGSGAAPSLTGEFYRQRAQDVVDEALKRKLMATALKQGVGAIGDAMKAPQAYQGELPDFIVNAQNKPIQINPRPATDNPYMKDIYGYDPTVR